jgi:dephospho-CoA kinase
VKKLIGLTGKYCAGKNQIAYFLEQRGLAVLDIDVLGHDILEVQKDAVIAGFGKDIIDSSGKINRRLLGKEVFNNSTKLILLERIIHPAINHKTEQWISAQSRTCVLNAALLHKSGVFDKLDFIIMVSASFPYRLMRAKYRDRLPWKNLLARFASQKGFTSKYLSGKADIYRIENPGFPVKPGDLLTRRQMAKLERRIDDILVNEGIL